MAESQTSNAGPEIDITVMLPCYNEAPRIVSAVENNIWALEKAGLKYEIIVIDDGSKDGSPQVVQDFINAHPNLPVRLKVNEKNRGLAYNFVEGAFMGFGKYYKLSCGDDPQPKEALYEVFKNVGKADILVPYMTEFGTRGWKRDFLTWFYTFCCNLLSGYKIKYYNGMPVYIRRYVLRWHPSSFGFGYSADMLTRLLDYEGCTYMQVPSWSVEKKGSGSTSLNMRNFLSVSHSLLEIGIRRFRRLLYGRDNATPREIKG